MSATYISYMSGSKKINCRSLNQAFGISWKQLYERGKTLPPDGEGFNYILSRLITKSTFKQYFILVSYSSHFSETATNLF